jgi:acetyltransferase
VREAESIGYPVVLKLNSETITHKTDVKGVQLNLQTEAGVRDAYETIRHAVTETRRRALPGRHRAADGQAGRLRADHRQQHRRPVRPGAALWHGRHAGGGLQRPGAGAAAAQHHAGAAHDGADRIFEALEGVRGRKPVDVEALERLLVRFSQLVVEQRWIKEIDINPLLASQRADHRARRARGAPRPGHRREGSAAFGHPPLPTKYSSLHAPNGRRGHIRPIRPEDEPMMAAFNRTLSPYSIYLRYFHPVSPTQLVSHEQLAALCFVDYDREMALVAERRTSAATCRSSAWAS